MGPDDLELDAGEEDRAEQELDAWETEEGDEVLPDPERPVLIDDDEVE